MRRLTLVLAVGVLGTTVAGLATGIDVTVDGVGTPDVEACLHEPEEPEVDRRPELADGVGLVDEPDAPLSSCRPPR